MTRRMSMSPVGPRTMGGLNGFGFTISFEEPAGHDPVAAVASPETGAPVSGEAAPVKPSPTPKSANHNFRSVPVLGSIE